MADRTFKAVLLGCLLVASVALFIAERSHIQLMRAVLDDLKAECDAGSLASYCTERRR